uniref:Transposase n=1 Tax=Rhizobium meliloti TaxID=382 RepID=I2E289_RHIML|nr:transposase [Sinorhizobium meliloti]
MKAHGLLAITSIAPIIFHRKATWSSSSSAVRLLGIATQWVYRPG